MFTDTRRIAKKPTRHAWKRIDQEIERIYYRHAQGVEINVLDISKIYRAGRDAAEKGADVEAAVLAAIAAVRIN